MAAISAVFAAVPAQAQGDLLVAPTRVVMNGGGSAEVVLSNIGSAPATYRITLELRRMDGEGDFKDVAEESANAVERAALDMIRYAPRRITLLPGQPQAVRLSARPAPDLPDGEYRVHMGFRAIPAALTPGEAAREAAAGGLSIRLTPIYGITIPVFVRKGRLEGGAALANPRLVKDGGQTFVELDMSRTGERSVFGMVEGKTARGEQVFQLRGIAIYPEVTQRKLRVAVTPEQQAKLTGPIRIEYRELPENGGQLIAAVTSAIR
ncbi:molecular chaperone [Novosphingobium sp.]|uniref:molecular chaperone n=1 Tax=Novosphingobium sp. TaxID=1874826 RepID=UPI002733DB29|nr:molecular chaperone [Novosphingobium sp.]MDP3906255.1 molecular chaperone [Novosphingobium sp.]